MVNITDDKKGGKKTSKNEKKSRIVARIEAEDERVLVIEFAPAFPLLRYLKFKF